MVRIQYCAVIVLLFEAILWGRPGVIIAEDVWPPVATQDGPAVSGELLVRYRHGVDEDRRRGKRTRHHARLLQRFRRERIELLAPEGAATVEDVGAAFARDPDVLAVEPNFLIFADDAAGKTHDRKKRRGKRERRRPWIPNDPSLEKLWNFHNTGQTGGTPGADIDLFRAWKRTRGDDDVVVAVIDSGIDYTHEDLVENLWLNGPEAEGLEGVDDDGNGYVDDVYGIDAYAHDSDPRDVLGHGTHVAGVIGAVGDNGVGVVGINQEVRILTCQALGPWGYGSVAGAIECLEYIRDLKARGVNIVASNNSWGGVAYSEILRGLIDETRDILFVAAAGNRGSDNDAYPYYPANFDLPNVIAVASTDETDDLAHHWIDGRWTASSSFGRRTVHVGAPGVDVFSTLPQQTHWGASMYGYLSGTSMATPHVTGLAALIKADRKKRTWREIRNLILAGGEETEALWDRTISGRRINAFFSLVCRHRTVFSVLEAPAAVTPGEPVVLSALSIDCAKASGPVWVEAGSGERIDLRDDGLWPDQAAGDGIFSVAWSPQTEASVLDFVSDAGSERVFLSD